MVFSQYNKNISNFQNQQPILPQPQLQTQIQQKPMTVMSTSQHRYP